MNTNIPSLVIVSEALNDYTSSAKTGSIEMQGMVVLNLLYERKNQGILNIIIFAHS